MTAITIRAPGALLRMAAGVLCGLVLAGCDPAALGGGGRGDGSVQVALLVPTGAPDAQVGLLGQSLADAARLAVADIEGAEIDLRIYDTAGDTAQAAQLARQAVSDGAEVIVGPLFAEAANAAGLAAASTRTPVLSFSNTTAVAGGNVFILGATFENTARRLLDYAARQGLQRVMVVNGDTPAEQVGRDAILRAAQTTGMQVVATAGFPMSQQGLAEAAPQIVAEARATQAQLIFLTSGADAALPFVSTLLPDAGLTPDMVQYAGLTRWDSIASALALPGLQGGWYTRPDTQALSTFSTRYSQAYGTAPQSLAGLGYDAIAAVGALAAAGQEVTPETLSQARGFTGASGAFRFRSDGTNERALAIATVNNNAVRILERAPRGFGGVPGL